MTDSLVSFFGKEDYGVYAHYSLCSDKATISCWVGPSFLSVFAEVCAILQTLG